MLLNLAFDECSDRYLQAYFAVAITCCVCVCVCVSVCEIIVSLKGCSVVVVHGHYVNAKAE